MRRFLRAFTVVTLCLALLVLPRTVANRLFTVQLVNVTSYPAGLHADESALYSGIAVDVINNALDAGNMENRNWSNGFTPGIRGSAILGM